MKNRGNWGEALVAEYLRKKHYDIRDQGFRCRFGEIDLVAEKRGVLCFVEVKLRSRTDYGLPREFVTPEKQKRLRITAEYYLSRFELDCPCRFDVAEVYTTDGQYQEKYALINYIEDSF